MLSLDEISQSRKKTMRRLVFGLNLQHPIKVHGFELKNGTPVLVDGEIRDHALWSGDYYGDGPAAFKYVDNGAEIWRNSLLAFAAKQFKSGRLHACLSTKLGYRSFSLPGWCIDSYSLWWVLAANEYLVRVEDPKFEKAVKSVLDGVIRYFTPKVDSDLLLKMNWPNIDWNWTIVRQRKSALANILWYESTKIANRLGMPIKIDTEKFKESFDRAFWNEKEGVYKDGEVNQLDANYMAIVTGLASQTRGTIIMDRINKLQQKYGRVSYIGAANAISPWHRNQVSPFLEYLHLKALLKLGQKVEAKDLYVKTMSEGIGISRKYGMDTVPEFWKIDGTLGGLPDRIFLGKLEIHQPLCVSLCTGWGTFGDYEP